MKVETTKQQQNAVNNSALDWTFFTALSDYPGTGLRHLTACYLGTETFDRFNKNERIYVFKIDIKYEAVY